MSQMNNETEICPSCGKGIWQYSWKEHWLHPFTMLHQRYIVGRVLGEGNFGITYLAYDETLEKKVAIKEYYPAEIALGRNGGKTMQDICIPDLIREEYQEGKNNFLWEARLIFGKFNENGLVGVQDYFEENKTAYLVMEYLSGGSLTQYLEEKPFHRIGTEESVKMLLPILEALMFLHSLGIIHNDISPDNMVFDGEKNLKLIDFGAAGQKGKEKKEILLKHTYASTELYGKKDVGPWSDIYSLCAVWYQMLTGKKPISALDRMNGKKLPEIASFVPVDMTLSQSIMRGMEPEVQKRYFSVANFMEQAGIKSGHVKELLPVVRNHWAEKWLRITTETGDNLPAQKNRNGKWIKKRILKISGVLFVIVVLIAGTINRTYYKMPEKYFAYYAHILKKQHDFLEPPEQLSIDNPDYQDTVRYIEEVGKENTKEEEKNRYFELTKEEIIQGNLVNNEDNKLYLKMETVKYMVKTCMNNTSDWFQEEKDFDGDVRIHTAGKKESITIQASEKITLKNEKAEELVIRYDVIDRKCFWVEFTGKEERVKEFMYKMTPVLCPETYLTQKECEGLLSDAKKEYLYYEPLYPQYTIELSNFGEGSIWTVRLGVTGKII